MKVIDIVNINDIKAPEEMPENIPQAIFDKQMVLAYKYAEIEGMGDLLETRNTNLDTLNGQVWIKDFSWRVTEELTEAFEGIEFPEMFDEQHYWEEVTDALHFFVELCIIAGYEAKDLPAVPMAKAREYTLSPKMDGSVRYDIFQTILYLGLACNCLKNKKWKQTQMLTDRKKFKMYIDQAWRNLIDIYLSAGLSLQDVYNLYFKKNAVNTFRQNSKY